MQLCIQKDHENKIISVAGTGEPDVSQMIKSVWKLNASPEVKLGYSVLLDFHQTDRGLSLSEIRKLAVSHRKVQANFRDNRTALVVRQEDVKLAHIMCMLVRKFGIRIEAYKTREQAEEYLQTGLCWDKPA